MNDEPPGRVGQRPYLDDRIALFEGLTQAGIGIWRWEVGTERLGWTENLEAVHRLPCGAFDGTLDSFRNDIHPDDAPAVWAAIEATLSTGRPYRIAYRTRGSDADEPVWIEASGGLVKGADGRTWLTGACLDVSERVRGEAELRRRLSQQRALERFGSYALAEADFGRVMDRAVAVAAEVLDVPLTKILVFSDAADSLLLTAGVGWQEGLVGHGRVGIGRDSQAGYTLTSPEPVIVDDLREETRFSGPELLHRHGVVSGMSVVIPGDERRPFGVFGVHDRRLRRFLPADAEFLASMANIVAGGARQSAAAAHRLLLMREMAHRAGNMLQLVSTIANQTFSGDRPLAEALTAFSERLGSLSRANYLIARGGWTATRFMLVAEETLQPFRERLTLRGRDILLPPELCFDLGLVVHELATNSAKYGALGAGDGRAELAWDMKRNGDGPVFELEWHDPVRSTATAGDGRGFGSRLMQALVERKWEGSITIEATDSYRCAIRIPLPMPASEPQPPGEAGA